MDTPSISLTTTKKPVKNIEIDGHGYKVRSLGAGEMLSLGQVQRKMAKIDTSNTDKLDEAQQAQLFDALEIMINTIKNAFDDGVGGVETDKLINRLDPEDIGLLLEQVFSVKAPDGQKQT